METYDHQAYEDSLRSGSAQVAGMAGMAGWLGTSNEFAALSTTLLKVSYSNLQKYTNKQKP